MAQFYKVASIRELVPRLYVEVAILRCYRLLLPADQLPPLVAKLNMMVRVALRRPGRNRRAAAAWHNAWPPRGHIAWPPVWPPV